MKFTACLLVALTAMAADAAILPLPLYHPAAYNLVQPLAVVPSNAWSTFVRSNVIGGSYAYAVQNNEALHAISSVSIQKKVCFTEHTRLSQEPFLLSYHPSHLCLSICSFV